MRAARNCALAFALALGLVASHWSEAHVVPPERLHPIAESYRLMNFVLSLNPIEWERVQTAADVIAERLGDLAPEEGQRYRVAVAARIAEMSAPSEDSAGPPTPHERKAAAREIFELSTRAASLTLALHLKAARAALADYTTAAREFDQARQIWAAFEPEIKATDRRAFLRLGECWLELAESLGTPGVLGMGAVAPDPATFDGDTRELLDYLAANYSGPVTAAPAGLLAPLPAHSTTFDPTAPIPAKLPPGADINKQLPRPRQILNMAARGVDESETALIALGDMGFDSSFIFGEPARSLVISCNTCHNKGVTNPSFFIPGLSPRRGGVDVSNAFFAPHASNGHFDPLDIPDLRGIRYTAPYGRNGRFDSLREFTRNVIVNEFNGPEPDPLLLDAMVAYMLEFDFLPNPSLDADGTLGDQAPEAARRGEVLFNRSFGQMGDRSCATCHIPSDNFIDRKRHDIGTVAGAERDSRDRALDTPTLLSARHTAPYFHDGSAPTLRSVNVWFNGRYGLGLAEHEIDDLTAYLEVVGDGVDAYEDTLFTLESELEEFKFFLSAYEFLVQRNETDLLETTFQTIAVELRAHKWDVQDTRHMPVLDRLAELMDGALAASKRGDLAVVSAHVAEYRELYAQNAEQLR